MSQSCPGRNSLPLYSISESAKSPPAAKIGVASRVAIAIINVTSNLLRPSMMAAGDGEVPVMCQAGRLSVYVWRLAQRRNNSRHAATATAQCSIRLISIKERPARDNLGVCAQMAKKNERKASLSASFLAGIQGNDTCGVADIVLCAVEPNVKVIATILGHKQASKTLTAKSFHFFFWENANSSRRSDACTDASHDTRHDARRETEYLLPIALFRSFPRQHQNITTSRAAVTFGRSPGTWKHAQCQYR